MKKQQIIISAITVLVLFIFGFVFFSKRLNKSTTTSDTTLPDNTSLNEVGDTSEDKTPEQVLLEMEERENPDIQGPLSAEIVSPEGDSFQMSQARLYRAEVTNGLSNLYKITVCNWKFYLNEYSEEVLYKEQTSPMGNGTCGFTSTFIDKRGKLRVVLDVVLSDKKTGEVLDTFTTEKNYLVL